jgi:hypothetical protein
MNPIIHHKLGRMVSSLQALRCWYASCGGAAGAAFQLALGEKVPRRIPVKNPMHSAEYCHFEGEANLLVWCTWRLDAPDRPVTSSDDTAKALTQGLQKLVGATIESVSLTAPAWDLTLEFSNLLALRIFCDHVPGDPSFDGNWEIWARDAAAFVGPGAQHVIQTRSEAEGGKVVVDKPTGADL